LRSANFTNGHFASNARGLGLKGCAGFWQHGVIFMLVIWFFSCTAPAEHSNPLDPKSPAFTEAGAIAGTVTTYYAPSRPLAEVEVRLSPGPALTFTNNRGEFSWHNLPAGEYELQAALAGYAPKKIAVQLEKRQNLSLTIPLNGLPKVDSASITTERRTLPPNTTRFFLQIEDVAASDPDGFNDIKRLTIVARDFSFADTLTLVDRVNGRWRRQFRPEELPAEPSLPAWPGHPLFIQIEDWPGEKTQAGPFYISRVLQETPEAVAPANNGIITAGPLYFQWRVNPIPYPYTQEVEIQDVLDPDSKTVFPGIAAGITIKSYSGGGLPPAGNYIWTVKIVDEFGNSSRSKPAAFQVQ
jgi:hypothetical protein